MNLEQVARRANVSTATVSRVLNHASIVKSSTRARGFEVVMANTDYRSEQLVSSVRLMIGRRVAGLAAIRWSSTTLARRAGISPTSASTTAAASRR